MLALGGTSGALRCRHVLQVEGLGDEFVAQGTLVRHQPVGKPGQDLRRLTLSERLVIGAMLARAIGGGQPQ